MEETIFCQLGTPEAEQYGGADISIRTECNSLCIRNNTDVTSYINGMILKTNEVWCIDELPGCMYVIPLSLRFESAPTTGLIYVQRYVRSSKPARF